MGKIKYIEIYEDILHKINQCEYTEKIPSENILATKYSCSRNTIRRAVNDLISKGVLQSHQGKGVFVVKEQKRSNSLKINEIETIKELNIRNNTDIKTKLLLLKKIKAGNNLSMFKKGTPLYHIKRLRILNDNVIIIDENFFDLNLINGLTKEICENSIYEHIENTLNLNIKMAKRKMIVSDSTEDDMKFINSKYLITINSLVFNSKGELFEYTISKHNPNFFSFEDIVFRIK